MTKFTDCPECRASITGMESEAVDHTFDRPVELLETVPREIDLEPGPVYLICANGHRTEVNRDTLMIAKGSQGLRVEFELA